MLDIKFIRENKDVVVVGSKKKHIDFDVDKLIFVDDERLKILKEVEELRSEINRVSNDIARDQDPALKIQLIEEMRGVKDEIKIREEKLREIMKEWYKLMLEVPNIPDMSVPEGENDEQNSEIRTWGEKTSFDFTPKNHISIMEDLDLADFARGTKVSGFRGYFIKNDGALLFFALWQYFLDYFVKIGYTPMIVPSMVRKEALFGTGYLPQGEQDLYKTQDENYLAGTAEVATMSYFSGEIIPKETLPRKFITFSPCFRREAGSHGKDTKGIIRVHEFYKLEQVLLCEASHEISSKLHEEITAHVEHLLQELKLPYRVVVNCGGDLGLGQVKKYDIETWMPSEDKYRETHSSSYFHDFQTRRLNIRYKDDDGKIKYLHSLNNTAVATSRVPAAILENYQTIDGKVKIPEVLRNYMGGREYIG
ncbi:MAG: serine--tRNA ligase [Candidatus Paceibacterota bacterium]|jgi:seryl-tRNA synthetase